MNLSKHKNGNYYIYYFNRAGKRNSISTKTKIKSEALSFLTSFRQILKEKESLKTIPISLKDFSFEYLKYSESIHSPNTTKSIKSFFNNLNDYFGNCALTDLNKDKLSDYSQERSKQVSAYVVKREFAYLSVVINYALGKKYLCENPIKGIKKIKLPEKLPLFFSEMEFQILLNVTESKDLRDLFTFGVNTGLREMELITLRWTQIDFRNRLLILDNRNHLTKSKKIRNIPLNLKAMQVLTERQIIENSDFVFTYKSEPIKQHFISHKFKKIIIKSGLNPKLNVHSLRHTFASWLIQSGVSIYSIQKLLGHSDPKMTFIYSHLRSDDLMDSVNKLNN
ncbi:MAG: tyrosine-type recombinase/integrase [Ignavibacteriaceae bacterium]